MSELKETSPSDSKATTQSEPPSPAVRFSPDELVTMNRAIIAGFTDSLTRLQHKDYDASINLNFPATILFYLGTGLIILAIPLRVVLALKSLPCAL
jgi:hypothetical protein